MKWEKVEDKHKTGEVFLIACSYGGRGYITIGSWKQDNNIGYYTDTGEFDEDGDPIEDWVGEEGWFGEHGDDFSIGYYYSPLDPIYVAKLPELPEDLRG